MGRMFDLRLDFYFRRGHTPRAHSRIGQPMEFRRAVLEPRKKRPHSAPGTTRKEIILPRPKNHSGIPVSLGDPRSTSRF